MAEAGTTVLLATHNFDEAIQLGSTVAILRGGRLVASRALGSGMAVEELRSFYFSQFEPSSEFAAPILGGLS
jgi:ABC-type multidrug transport system ATPase subunit